MSCEKLGPLQSRKNARHKPNMPKIHQNVAIPRSWYRAQKALKAKKTLPNPPPQVGPRKSENRIKTEERQQWPPPKRTFSQFFYVYFVFSGPDPGWQILLCYFVFFSFSFRISWLEGVFELYTRTAQSQPKRQNIQLFVYFGILERKELGP